MNHFVTFLLFASLSQGLFAADNHGKAESESSTMSTRSDLMRSDVADLLDYLEASRKEKSSFPLATIETHLKALLTRTKDNGPWVMGESLTNNEQEVLLDNMELLLEYAREVISLKEANPEASDQTIKILAASNIAKRFRLTPKKRNKWFSPNSSSATLTRETTRRESLSSEGLVAPFEDFAAFLNGITPKRNAPKFKIDLSADLDEIKADPEHYISTKGQALIDDVKKSDPEAAKRIEDTLNKYDAQVKEFKRFVEDKVKGKSVQGVAQNIREELKSRSEDIRKMDVDLEGLLKKHAGIDVNAEKLEQDARDEIKELGKKIEDRAQEEKRKIEQKVNEELKNGKKKLEELFK